MKLVLALLTGLMFLTACEMQQDPLKDAPEAVREGRAPEAEKPVQEKPFSKDAMFIDAPMVVNGRVGSPVEFKINGRVMVEGVTFKLSIDNMADFEGATFDEATGAFKWIPKKAVVAGLPSIELPLRITLATDSSPKYPLISVEKKTISLMVVNVYSKPIVQTITGNSTLVTGTTHTMEYTLEDIDALSEGDVSLDVRDCAINSYRDSIAHLVSVRNISKSASTPNKYEGRLEIDLRNADNLSGSYYCFALQAISKHGVKSELYKRDVTIQARPKTTRITMESVPALKIGETAQIAFTIYDSSASGVLRMVSMDNVGAILPGSSLTCKSNYTAKFQLDCSGVITTAGLTAPTADAVYDIKMEVENTLGSQSVKTTHTLRINVKAATP
ncbi:MAG: hypothetical protein OM95_03265 [Bdellovibrio sp. ArHS]|uniref:hypothetical protein n=1 Tax=Bdellovibrio sp. ArHS TaxID=1569284 RepID=UPI0005838534|nr:hypothetical protein [Bdellovibrio sp. ArHS]KHD89403.1 MAG: hypothetical protein OM95_03265 [Bdellovibrio sp. ArHS]